MTRPEAMRFARDMYDDGNGWTVTKIQRHLNARGIPCVWETVKGWVDPVWRERRNLQHQEAHRRYWRKRNGTRVFRVVDESARRIARERLRREVRLDDVQIEAVLEVTGVALGPSTVTPRDPFERMRELREVVGLSYGSIASLMRHEHGKDMTPEQVRYAIQVGHMPRPYGVTA